MALTSSGCDRSKYVDAAIAELKNSFAHNALLIAQFDAVHTLRFYLAHLVGGGVAPAARAPVDTGSQKEVSADLMRDRKRVVLAVVMGGCQSYVST